MSTIIQQPEALTFSKNVKNFILSSTQPVSFLLQKGTEQIINEVYYPGSGNLIEIDLREIIDRVLSVELPLTGETCKDQSGGYSDFTATIDEVQTVVFQVVKGGVADLSDTALNWLNSHWLTWQIQDKKVLQIQPEWLSVFTNASRVVKVKAYFQDGTDETKTLQNLTTEGKLYTIDVSWATVNSALTKKNPVAWDVWFEDGSNNRLSFIQRYILRNAEEEENLFIWQNSVGGIDSVSFRASNEDDKQLEHQTLQNGDDSYEEYYVDYRKRAIKQLCGYVTKEEARWIDDFFFSKKRYRVEADGAVKAIVFVESKNVKQSENDLEEGYGFTYRLASDSDLLNLDRTFDPLPAPEVPVDFF